MPPENQPGKFPLGRVVATQGALNELSQYDILQGLRRHHSGDWGDLEEEDLAENERSLIEGFRLFSVYHGKGGTRFYVITEHDRSYTTVLLPHEY